TSKGCGGRSKVSNKAELKRETARLIGKFHQPVIAESYLAGREFTVGIVGNGTDARVIAVMEIVVRPDADSGIYSYEIKENWEQFVTLSIVDDAEAQLAGTRALAAYHMLGCRDAARVDLKSDGYGSPQFLEVNPIAGLHPTHSDLPILTTKAGFSYDWLIGEIIASGCARYGLSFPAAGIRAA
ncbi:MAG: hypothetical protein WD185_10100, partial [Sneathiella sp.]